MNRLRILGSVLALVLALVSTGALSFRAHAQDCPGGSTTTPCTDEGGGEDEGGGSTDGPCGNGGSGTSGGGGGQCTDTGGPDETERPRPQPVRQTQPDPVQPVAPRPVSRPRATTRPATGTATNRGGLASTDAQLAAWAKHFETTPEEVRSWFTPYSSNDTIGGEGSGRTLHAGEDYTISNNGAIADGAAAAGMMDMREGNSVQVMLHSTPVPLGSTSTTKGGRFTLTAKIPPSTKLGRHFVVALAPNLKQGQVAFVFPINVVAAEPVFNDAAVPQASTSDRSSTPWLLIEFVLGTAMIGGLVAYRVRRNALLRQRGSYGPA